MPLTALIGIQVVLMPVIAWWLTRIMLNYASSRGVLDIPNQRSAHQVPIPRGGGMAIVLPVLIMTGEAYAMDILDFWNAAAIEVGGFAVATIGWLDDHRPLGPLARGLVHLLAAGFAWYCLDGPGLAFGGFVLGPNWLTHVVGILAIAWSLNLYNFMDGTDGLAGSMAVTVGALGAVVLWFQGAHGLALVSGTIALASSGFLVCNWPPARIFMGDVGSGFLGYHFAVLAFAGQGAGVPGLLWAVLLALFVADATYTLCWRMWRGETWYAAHRTHAYQQLLNFGWSHRRILREYMRLTLVAIFPVTVLGVYRYDYLPIIALILYVALLRVWWRIQERARLLPLSA